MPPTYVPPTKQPSVKASDVLIEAKALLNAHPEAWIKWEGHRALGGGQHAYCALGALSAATPYRGFDYINKKYLCPAANEVAKELGRPLEEEFRGHRQGRERSWGADPAYFNNTAENLGEVNAMFCRAIEKAVTEELKEEHPDGNT